MLPKKPVTMDDIARLANVSKPTVSRALRDSPLVKSETKELILSLVQSHGYSVNRNAQNLRHRRTDTIAVSLDYQSHGHNHISDPFIYELLTGVSAALGDRNKVQLLCAPNQKDMDAFQHILSSHTADGFIFLGQGHREPMLGRLARAGVPIVVWGAAGEDTEYCVVGSDNQRGGHLVGEHFLKLGRRRFLFVGDTTFREIALRRAGLVAAVRAGGAERPVSDLHLADFSYASAYEAARGYLDRAGADRPDAVFACSDTVAMAFINACRDLGLRVPKDVSVVGYNDINVAGYFNPPLTTIRQDIQQAGEALVAELEKIMNREPVTHTLLPTELIVRGT